MDNDNKINNIQNPEVRLFIDDEMISSMDEASTDSYEFKDEYENIKKAKSYKVSIVLFSTVFVVCLLCFIFSVFIEHQDSKIDVSIDAFEDLNLQSLLDELDIIDTAIQDKNREKDMLSKNYQYIVDTLALNTDAEFFTIASMNLTPVALNRETATINRLHDASVMRATDDYNTKVAIVDDAIAILQGEYDILYDPTVFDTEVAKSNSQKAVFDLEKQQIISDFNYEFDLLRQEMTVQQVGQLDIQKNAVQEVSEKYQYDISLLDPMIEDEIVNMVVGKVLETKFLRPDFVALRENAFLTKEESYLLNDAENLLTAYDLIFMYLSVIPYENSLKEYSRALQMLNIISATGYDNLFFALMDTRKLAKERIDSIILEATTQYNKLQDEYNGYKFIAEQEISIYQKQIEDLALILDTLSAELGAAQINIEELVLLSDILSEDLKVAQTKIEDLSLVSYTLSTELEASQDKIEELTLISDTLSTEIADLENQLKLALEQVAIKDRYEEYMSFVSETKLGDGFVMNTSDKKAIAVFITPATQSTIAERQMVYIFSDDSRRPFAEGTVTKGTDGYYLMVDDAVVASTIRINDVLSLSATLNTD